MKNLSVLGSTGSIGRNTLQIVQRFPEQFNVSALAAHSNIDLLAEQIERFQPELAVVSDRQRAGELRERLPKSGRPDIRWSTDGYLAAASLDGIDTVVTAVVGAAGLLPTLAAVDAGKDIALANKETLVLAGELVMKRARQKNVSILPVDSEHSAIFQCLSGNRHQDLHRILLTASGGPFLDKPSETFGKISPEDALRHPNWQMGPKITIDSATLMNKGLEVIEARWLFGVSLEQIEVVIHPQSIVHSMVAFCDGSIIAQMGIPDMKAAIAYALSWPRRLPLGQPLPDFNEVGALTFRRPDLEKFPCLALAIQAASRGGTLPAVLNAANEVAVGAFLDHRLRFVDIAAVVRAVMQRHETVESPGLEQLLEADRWARQQAAAESCL
ncbi:MAG: 1-deoxy-D-xylulose 5-phosphate reductoisomerase [Deltaproteobacteria bacterium SG8_13]|nr:MAG: 1-deoxy-D-xylulose 5-phosphate reductoisomerase [Deltaproteobacteria bacterium SG8_13]